MPKITSFTNAFGTITALLTMLVGFMASIGCTPGAVDFAATCSISWLPSQYAVYAATAFGALSFVLKLSRPGGWLHSLFGSTAVVVPPAQTVAGTVTPAQVATK